MTPFVGKQVKFGKSKNKRRSHEGTFGPAGPPGDGREQAAVRGENFQQPVSFSEGLFSQDKAPDGFVRHQRSL